MSPIRRSVRVLVVDDEVAMCEMVRRMLRNMHVEVACDGADAIAALNAAVYDVVICDLHMPTVSGADVYRAAIGRSPRLASRFILMTGGATTEPARAFLETFPADQLLYKPFSAAQLADAVAACLDT